MIQKLLVNAQPLLESYSPLALLGVLLAGVLTSFTPCVYPLVPITITFVGAKASGSRRQAFFLSLFYALGIAITYAVLGMMASLTGKLFGQVQNSPWVFFGVGNIFLLLGLNVLGTFNLALPQVIERLPQTKTGYVGSFLVGLAAGLVMGPCTAPVLAVLLGYVASRQNVVFGFLTLFIFAVGMNTLLIIAGTFSGFLTSLPKPGKWMERIKKLLGWGMILIGEYFLIQMGRMLI